MSGIEGSMRLVDLLAYGGWAMVPIYVCSAIALCVFIERILVLRGARIGDLSWLPDVMEAARKKEFDRIAALCRNCLHPGARVVEAMTAVWSSRADRVEAEAGRETTMQLHLLEKHVSILSFIGKAAPLLGLLGTVIGMVQLFIGLQHAPPGQVDIGLFASGIWKALLTTAAGVVVAVPSLAAYTYLTARIDRLHLKLHDIVERMLTAVPGDDVAEVRQIGRTSEVRR